MCCQWMTGRTGRDTLGQGTHPRPLGSTTHWYGWFRKTWTFRSACWRWTQFTLRTSQLRVTVGPPRLRMVEKQKELWPCEFIYWWISQTNEGGISNPEREHKILAIGSVDIRNGIYPLSRILSPVGMFTSNVDCLLQGKEATVEGKRGWEGEW